jgi:hypothetical protein
VKQIRKYKTLIAAWFVAGFVSAFTVKTFHHLEAHGEAFPCEHHAKATLNFHAEGEDSCCPICEFFFSPLYDQVSEPATTETGHLTDVFSIPVNDVTLPFTSFLYLLRAPPL